MSDFRKAQKMAEKRKFYNAIELYLSFVHTHPRHEKSPQALFEVGRLQQMVLDEPRKAVESYRKLVSSYPVNKYTIQAQRRLAEIYKKDFSKYHQAIIEYEKLLHAAPGYSDAAFIQFEIARCYTLLHNYSQAAIEYEKLIKKHPKYDRLAEVYFEMGNNAYIGGRYKAAVKAYQTVEDRFPKSPFRVQATFGMANAYEEMDDIKNARLKYKEVLKDYPSPKVVQIRLQGLLKREQKRKKALSQR